MSDIEIDGQWFRCAKLPTRMQLYVGKRLIAGLGGLTPLFRTAFSENVMPDGETATGVDAITVMQAVGAMAATINQLSDTDADFILDNALNCVAWRQGEPPPSMNGRWQALRAPGGAFLLGSADVLDTQLRLLWEVLKESFSSFSIAKLLSSQTTGNGLDAMEQVQQMVRPMVSRPTGPSS
jgi:hypothetical protein